MGRSARNCRISCPHLKATAQSCLGTSRLDQIWYSSEFAWCHVACLRCLSSTPRPHPTCWKAASRRRAKLPASRLAPCRRARSPHIASLSFHSSSVIGKFFSSSGPGYNESVTLRSTGVLSLIAHAARPKSVPPRRRA